MRKRCSHPLPTSAEVDKVVTGAISASLATNGLDAETVGYDIRLIGSTMTDGIARICIGYAMHRDDMARPCFEIVEPAEDPEWRATAAGHVAAIAMHVGRLEARRSSYDPEGVGRPAGRRHWDIHPVTASILSLYRRLPRLDGRHRLDGTVGRLVQLGSAPGVEGCLIAYGDGVIRMVEAVFTGGGRLRLDGDAMKLMIPGEYPITMESAMRRARPARIASELGHDPRTSAVRVKKVSRPPEGGLEITFSDILVPWDPRARGDEDWRRKRLAA